MSAHALSAPVAQFANDVRAGLGRRGQKELPSQYLYDELGTALFEAITFLPEYGLTRADERLLRRYAPAIGARLPHPVMVVELGSGSGRKTRALLEEVSARGPVSYYPIDISGSALERCKAELAALPSIGIVGLERPYLDGLKEAARDRGPRDRLLVLFLGSTIGNFDSEAAEDFLRGIRGCLRAGDLMLLGTDLVKPEPALLAAYDDPTGVTAAFNLNLLARINRELGGNFDLRQFAHEARWNGEARRVEMHLISRRRQFVSVPAAGLTIRFEEGESIWTESSHKFRLEDLSDIARRCGFASVMRWVDPEWPFAENLWTAMPLSE